MLKESTPEALTKRPAATNPRGRFARWATWMGSLLVVLATLGVLGGLAYWKYIEIQAAMQTPPPPEMPTEVGIEPVSELTWRNSTTSIGTILAPRSITVNNELPGTVTEVCFEPGGIVDSGDVLLRQDIRVEEAQLAAAEARESFAHSTWERNRQMAQTNAVTELELEEIESQWLQAKAMVDELKAVIARKTITAPFRGQVGLSDIHEGQYLAAGSLITSLQSIEDHLLVDFMLPQGVDSQIEIGDTVTLSSSGDSFVARVTGLDSQADRSTRNVRVRARLDHPPVRLSPGDSVQVRIEYGLPITLPAVPAEAVRRSPQGPFVFVAETDAQGALRASLRPVMTGTTSGNQIGLATGVRLGERVVAEGSFKLKDGMLIAPSQSVLPASETSAGAREGE